MWPNGEVKLLSDQVLGSVDVAESCGRHTNFEPRSWRSYFDAHRN